MTCDVGVGQGSSFLATNNLSYNNGTSNHNVNSTTTNKFGSIDINLVFQHHEDLMDRPPKHRSMSGPIEGVNCDSYDTSEELGYLLEAVHNNNSQNYLESDQNRSWDEFLSQYNSTTKTIKDNNINEILDLEKELLHNELEDVEFDGAEDEFLQRIGDPAVKNSVLTNNIV